MLFDTEITNDVDEKEWNRTLLKNPESYAYQTTNFVKTFQDSYNSKPLFISVRNNKSEIVGQLAAIIHKEYLWADANLLLMKIGTKLNLNSIIRWYYGPIIHDYSHRNEITEKILIALNNIAKKNKISMIDGSTTPSKISFPEKISQKYKFNLRKWSTYIIDLTQDIETLYNSLDKKTRYDIRKSEKNNLTFEVANDLLTLKEFIKIKIESKKLAKQKIKKNQSFPEERYKHLHSNNLEKLFLVKNSKTILAGILAPMFNGNVVQTSVATPFGKEFLAGVFATWNAIKWCNSQKFLRYDMGGVNPNATSQKEKSIDFFKSKWGGEKINYYYLTKIFDYGKVRLSRILKDPKQISMKIKSKA